MENRIDMGDILYAKRILDQVRQEVIDESIDRVILRDNKLEDIQVWITGSDNHEKITAHIRVKFNGKYLKNSKEIRPDAGELDYKAALGRFMKDFVILHIVREILDSEHFADLLKHL
jgi:hypothetical protein